MKIGTETARGERGSPPARWRLRANSVLRHDLPASLVVFLVAVPLSLGIALASGAPIAAGLIAAIVGGVVAAVLGGAPLQVSGPAAGLTVIVAGAIQQFGWAVTAAITVAAGALQVLLGLSRIARAALAIAPAIVHAMLAGIGITIVLAQLHVLLGGTAQSSPIRNLMALPDQILGNDNLSTVFGVLTIGVLVAWPVMPAAVRRIPGPLVAVVGVTLLALGTNVQRVSLPGNVLALDFVPRLPTGAWFEVGVAVVTVAVIASVESLLSAVAVDKLHTGPRSDFNRELLGQGAANMVSGALGGLPITGVIVRGSTNVRAGARSRASAVLHGVWVLVFTALLAGLLTSIPLAVLAGLLVHVGLKLVNLRELKEVVRHGDLPVYLTTVTGVVVFDLLIGVLLGIGLSLLLMLRRTVWLGIRLEGDAGHRRLVVEGVLTFLSVPRLTRMLASIPPREIVTLELVVDYLDHAAFEALETWQKSYEQGGGTVLVDEIGHPWFGHAKAGRPTRNRAGARGALPRWLAPWSQWQAQSAVESIANQGTESPLRRGAVEFQRRAAPLVEPTLRDLAAGQKPSSLFVTCADARLVPNLITTSGPGDLFTVRNIGNLVPPHDSCAKGADSSVGAAIEFAVDTLGIREIVVCGHSGCGAMKALLDGPPDNAPVLTSWLRHGMPSAHRRTDQEPVVLRGAAQPGDVDQLALHNVLQQLDHLRQCPAVARAVLSGELDLVGMYFDVAGAQVYLYNAETGSFEPPSKTGPLNMLEQV